VSTAHCIVIRCSSWFGWGQCFVKFCRRTWLHRPADCRWL